MTVAISQSRMNEMLLNAEDRGAAKPCSDPTFRADVLAGLAADPRMVPARWFYDHRGSELFEQITQLPEYYPTRTEIHLLETHAEDISVLVGPGRAVVEFGSGSSRKTPILLNAIEPSAYIPIDISGDFLRESAAVLARRHPHLPVIPVEADFTRPLHLPERRGGWPPLGFFPGSTIGNLTPEAGADLLRTMAATLGRGALLLVGIDRIKSPDKLVPAYDDRQGVTAAFNLNLLDRINRELDGNIPTDAFRHAALWNAERSRIEMHLVATRSIAFSVSGRRFQMPEGDSIHTENSHKYDREGARRLLRAGGWSPIAEWTDPENSFAILLAGTMDLHHAR